MVTLQLYGLQMSSKRGVRVFMSGNNPTQISILLIYPGLQPSDLNIAAGNLLLGALHFEIFLRCLLVFRFCPVFQE
jgi:hypothetical protein